MDVEMYLNKNPNWESVYYADPAVARAPFTHAAVVTAALERGAVAEGILGAHRDTGNSRINVNTDEVGYPDVHVSLLDPRVGENGLAAMGIERETSALAGAFGLTPIRDLLAEGDTGFTFFQRNGGDD